MISSCPWVLVGVQTHGKSFILLVGNKVDLGAEELPNQ